jgi:hypothetical protein
MRTIAVIPIALLAAGCWTPGPGQLDPTRYPWDQPHRQLPPKGSYCIVSLETGSSTGISVGGGSTVDMPCKEPPAGS